MFCGERKKSGERKERKRGKERERRGEEEGKKLRDGFFPRNLPFLVEINKIKSHCVSHSSCLVILRDLFSLSSLTA